MTWHAGQGIFHKDDQILQLVTLSLFQQKSQSCLFLSDEKQRLSYESKSDNSEVLADRKLKSLFLCPNATTFSASYDGVCFFFPFFPLLHHLFLSFYLLS